MSGWLKEFAATQDKIIVAAAEENAKLREQLEMAWGIIANAGGGDWQKESQEWQAAAAKWRDRFVDIQ